jgi:hypothetical protein
MDCTIFTNARVGNIHSSLRQSQKLYRILWIAQYLPTPELKIFIGKYSMMPELGILEDDHKNRTQTNL